MTHALLTAGLFTLEFGVRLTMVAVILLRRRTVPTARIAWIVVILAVPVLGIVGYLAVGDVRLGRRRVARHREITQRVEAAAERLARPGGSGYGAIPEVYRSLATLAESVGHNQVRAGNRLQLLSDTDLFVQSLVEDIDAARTDCHLSYYVFLDDHSGKRVAAALTRAAARGVACRLLVDAVGSRAFARSPARRRLEETGVRVVEALPANPVRMLFARMDIRNHRKLAIIDGTVGYAGSHNLADAEFAIKPKYAPWVDVTVRMQGPVVRDLQILFIEDWFLDTDESLESLLEREPEPVAGGVPAQFMGTGPNSFNEALRQLSQAAFHAAREELILTTPYYVPDEATASALHTAARRGVETRLIVPARNDSPLVAAASRGFYESLLDAGVRIHEYRPGLLHAKTFTLDRDLALITTANLDRRSFELNFEASLVVYDTDFASELRFLQRAYVADSTTVDGPRWRRRRWPARLWHNTAGMLSPLL
ncbi:MAG: cardiolipin synthase [Planctomycetota bacterium]|jgi:cardiolipin synthase